MAGGNKGKNIHPNQRGRGWDDFVPMLQYCRLASALPIAKPNKAETASRVGLLFRFLNYSSFFNHKGVLSSAVG